MAKKSTSASRKAHYAAYENENRAVKNRITKLERHCKKFPDDTQAKKALKNSGNFEYRRNKSKSYFKVWTATKRKYAQLWVKFGYSGHAVLEKGFLDNHAFNSQGK